MTARESFEYEFLREQLKDFKDGQVRLENKLDLFRSEVSDDIKEIHQRMDLKVQPLVEKLQEHEQAIAKHSNFFNLAAMGATTGLASLGGLAAWAYDWLKARH